MKGNSMGKDLYVTRLTENEASLWEAAKPLLFKIDIELTERCNNNCIHCCINLPMDDRSAINRELSTEEIKDILKEAASLGCLRVRFTGGEPLLRHDFEELYIFARRLGLKVLLFTNGTLITPHLADLFTRIPLLEKMEVTVYGMSKKSYEAVTRKPGSFEAAWRGINLLLEKGIPFAVKGALLPPNRGDIDEFEAWASTIPWMDRAPSYSMFFDLRCRKDSEKRDRLIRGLRLSQEEGLEILTRGQEEFFRSTRGFLSRFSGLPGDMLFPCGAGAGRGCVDAYGSFQPCLMLRHPDTAYDLKMGSIKDALTNFFPKVRQMKANNPDYLARCALCFLKSFCEQCPAKSWTEHGTLDTPVEYFCEITHAKARYLGLLEEGEMAWKTENWRERLNEFLNREPGFQEKV